MHQGWLLIGLSLAYLGLLFLIAYVADKSKRRRLKGQPLLYSLSLKLGLSVFGAITVFGVVVASTMWLIRFWHLYNCKYHRAAVTHLLRVARRDGH